MSAASLDYARPVSELLRVGTSGAHAQLEKSAGAGYLVRGELDQDEYVRFLMMLWHVYDALESALAEHAADPVLAPSYNPAVLSRTAALAADIAHFLDVPASQWQSHPLHTALSPAHRAALAAYTARLHTVAHSHPALLLAHAYVRYLGDLSGGQTIKRRLAKAYGLDPADRPGVQFYAFHQPASSAAPGTQGDLKRLKEWFRAGMDSGVGDDAQLKAAMLDEANIAFALNAGLFDALRAPANGKPALHLRPSSPVLGDPTTPVSPSTPSDDDRRWVTNIPPPKPLMDVGDAKNSMYSATSVVTFIVAAGLAHFIIVVGGLSGQRGYDKLQNVLAWLGVSV
ncbi:heme oxygenase-like protein [Gloeophyllum trabeum ATCC 11539]|uniref:Heme oxygenase-like protein n=1 Tax=Gloeophyllum trabeum (strain ATCC 11539 / FP-39264 / Madison 617) TaxID=670483 RepID=S7RJL2_GLOTA|nr:heme oxygenase-like protein [Gloeophyllum trabeum ATCC 11539]EPQ54525.1 heme oxygenase-like protein [Gloeophyllum trabeum ATCC 11539]